MVNRYKIYTEDGKHIDTIQGDGIREIKRFLHIYDLTSAGNQESKVILPSNWAIIKEE